MSSDALLPLVYIGELQRTREAYSIKKCKRKHSWSDCSLEKPSVTYKKFRKKS